MEFLTKSRYQLASDCPRKLYFKTHHEIYSNKKNDDEFLKALADGGHQVGALARALFPSGIMIASKNSDEACQQTSALLKQSEVVIFEAAIRVNQYFIRIDVLRKTAGRIDLLEVKAKSWDSTPGNDNKMVTSKGTVVSGWVDYLEDVAFQTWVAREAHLGVPIVPHLMLVDKSVVVSGDGLHQLFRIDRQGAQVTVRVTDPEEARRLGNALLKQVDVSDLVDAIIAGTAGIAAETSDVCGPSLSDRARLYAGYLAKGVPMPEKAPIGMHCKNCEFRTDADDIKAGMRSGFDQCWSERLAARHRPDRTPLFALWNYRATAGNSVMDGDGIYYLDEMSSSQLKKPNVRQERQLDAVHTNRLTEEIASDIGTAISGWTYPIHFLDFETATPALPFHRGMRPYQILGFQFSCHHLHADGAITHDEFLVMDPETFPSWRFVQALRKVLGNDQGTILRYSAHENTVLRALRRQMLQSANDSTGILQEIPAGFDVSEHAQWIDTITTTGDKDDVSDLVGPRSMVDLLPLVKHHYYHPRMGGSNSIKHVLPAVMTASPWLRTEYGKPLSFGTNLRGQVLWQLGPEGKTPRDPYELLPPVFEGIPHAVLEGDDEDEVLKSGGAAMMAYASMQYTDMPLERRQSIAAALLRYCELDTLAMLMIVQHWKHILRIK